MRIIAAICACLALAACQGEPDVPNTGLPNYDPHLVENQRTICEGRGGDFRRAGKAGAFVCFTTPRDAGKRCEAAGDCSSACLARSRTCSPIQPLFGCHEILDDLGRRVQICVD